MVTDKIYNSTIVKSTNVHKSTNLRNYIHVFFYKKPVYKKLDAEASK